jgi:hypothetical protein
MMGNVDGPAIEVLASDPDEESSRSARRPRALAAAVLLAALLVGAAAGAQLAGAVQRARAADPPPTRLSAAALAPDGGQMTATRSGAGWMTAVDLVVVDAGPSAIRKVLVRWGSPYETPLGNPLSVQPIDRLVRGLPQTISLLLYRPCTGSPAQPPDLQISWKGARTPTLVRPIGLDRVWTDLANQCVAGDAPINALDITVTPSAPQAGATQTIDLRFLNQGDQALSISVLGMRSGVQLLSGATFVVGPNTANSVRLRARVTDCLTALEDLSSAGVVYRIAARGHPSIEPTYSSDALSQVLAGLIYRTCARR